MNNILRISLNKKVIITQPLYQYDYGQKLKFIDLPLYASYEVHFSNHEHGDATVSIATSNEVAIPDTYLQSGRDVYVWVYVHTGRDDGETEYQITIPVIKRAKPINEEPTPEEESVITQTIAALNAAVTESREGVQRVEQAENNVNNLYALTEDAKNRTYTYKEEAELAASLLKNVSAEAETLQPGQPATASYANGVFNFGIPAGRDGGSGSSNILIVNATIDYEHAESETEYPLILDKTIDEMLAAEYTVLSVNAGGLYELVEATRVVDGETGYAGITWAMSMNEVAFSAFAEYSDGTLTATMFPGEVSTPYCVRIYKNSGSDTYYADADYSTLAKYAFDSSFGAGALVAQYAQRLIQLAEVKNYGQDNNAKYVFQYTEDGILTVITISLDSSLETVSVTLEEFPVEPFVIHMTEVNSGDERYLTGTFAESPEQLIAAIQSKRRVLLEIIPVSGSPKRFELPDVYTTGTYASAAGLRWDLIFPSGLEKNVIRRMEVTGSTNSSLSGNIMEFEQTRI